LSAVNRNNLAFRTQTSSQILRVVSHLFCMVKLKSSHTNAHLTCGLVGYEKFTSQTSNHCLNLL